MFILYYWSIAGAWFFIFDRLTGLGKLIGMQYHYLFDKMFPVNLDSHYLISLWMMGLFIIIFQLLILYGVRFFSLYQLKVNFHYTGSDLFYSLVALIFLAISIYFVYDVIIYSLILNESVYLNIRSSGIPYYSIHQLACWAMMLSITIPLVLYLISRLNQQENQNPGVLYWIVFAICNVYMVFIGSRHEAFLCGSIVLLMLGVYNKELLKHRILVLTIFFVWIGILALNDPFRSLTPLVCKKIGLTNLITTSQKRNEAEWYRVDRTFITHHNSAKSNQIVVDEMNRDTILYNNTDTIHIKKQVLIEYWKAGKDFIVNHNDTFKISNPHTSEVYYHLSIEDKVIKALSGILYSNEMFTGHFSLYGVLHHHIQVNTAMSFKYLLYSFIPKFIQEKRPLSSYEYYADSLGFPSTQGFTINHITSWYLNFSLWGILLGPIILALFIFMPLLLMYHSKIDNYKTAFLFVLCCIVAFAAMIVRSGPEAYKTWLVEGIVMPFILFNSGAYFRRMLQLKWSKLNLGKT